MHVLRSVSWSRLSSIACALALGIAVVVPLACGSGPDSTFVPTEADSGPPQGTSGGPFGETDRDGGAEPDANRQITVTLRDFRVFDAEGGLTVPDFENPPYNIGQDGGPSPGYVGDWDDKEIVSDTLGTDSKPVYAKGDAGKTLTTHGYEAFDKWFRDIEGVNLKVEMPLPTTVLPDGSSEYDSNKSGQLYDSTKPDGGRGFFPLDDGTPFATAFGNQGSSHNFCFTGEIHTEFTFRGGEYFSFRGDDDVWVFINKKLVINLGGIHIPRTAKVELNTLGLVVGQTYPLDFFFAERHAGGSNVLFQTTIALRPSGVK
jgi:fibro-slime domain-containing protein